MHRNENGLGFHMMSHLMAVALPCLSYPLLSPLAFKIAPFMVFSVTCVIMSFTLF